MSENAQDKTINCADCFTDFVFSVSDQAFYQQKNFADPKRCPSCRKRRKLEKEAGR